MMWIFNIKTKKARLVGRGDLTIPDINFDPNAVYCGNLTACSIKICVTIAAKYKLDMKGGDLEGAYLVTRANPDYPVYIKTPQGYNVPKGMVSRQLEIYTVFHQPVKISLLSLINVLLSVVIKTHHGT